ncbi:MAG: FtsB family cell division protein [Candidatus Levyibacteriota bacterium]
MSSRRFTPSVKNILILLTLFMLAILARNIIVSITSSYNRARMVEDLRGALEQKKQEQAYLTQKVYYAKTDQFVEDQARRKLGLVLPGEKVVIDERIDPGKPQVITPEMPNWQKWWKLFF